MKFGLQTENKDDRGSLEVLKAPLGLLPPKDIFRTLLAIRVTETNLQTEMLDYGEPHTSSLAADAPCILRSPQPAACCCVLICCC